MSNESKFEGVTEFLRKNAVLGALGGYLSAIAALDRSGLGQEALAPIVLLGGVLVIRGGLQLVEGIVLWHRQISTSGLIFMAATGTCGAALIVANLLLGMADRSVPLVYLGHGVAAWLTFSAEMRYNELASAGRVPYLSEFDRLSWLSLGSLRWIYGGAPDRERRARLFFWALVLVAVGPLTVEGPLI